MKTTSLLAALLAFPLVTQAADYVITVERKKDGQGALQGEVFQKTSQNWTGVINILHRAFKPSPDLEVRYIIFVKRQQLGQKENQELVDKVKGNAKVDSIKPGGNVTVTTSDVVLKKEQMEAGWRLAGGGRQKAEDSVSGVWVRLYDTDGNMVMEYANPTTLMQKYKWED